MKAKGDIVFFLKMCGSRYFVLFVLLALLASCGSGDKFAASFGKRRYMKGYYADMPGNVKSTQNNVVIASAEKENKVDDKTTRVKQPTGTQIKIAKGYANKVEAKQVYSTHSILSNILKKNPVAKIIAKANENINDTGGGRAEQSGSEGKIGLGLSGLIVNAVSAIILIAVWSTGGWIWVPFFCFILVFAALAVGITLCITAISEKEGAVYAIIGLVIGCAALLADIAYMAFIIFLALMGL